MEPAPQLVRHERLPWPLGLTWVAATRAQQALGVFSAAELAVRVLFSMVLTDVLDLDWPAKLEQRLRETQDNRGLERMAFGTRVDMLRLALKLHAGAQNRVLPDLQPWWRTAEALLLELVQARNQVTHLAALEEADPTEARRRFAQLLTSARWLQQVQLIHVDRVSRERGRFATHLYRLRGVAPWNELALELDTSFSKPLEGDTVYLGNASGTEWRLSPFFSARRRSVGVFDGLDKRGNPLFFDPTRSAADALEAAEGFPLPGEEWQLAAWGAFLDARKRTSSWRVSEVRPDALLQLPATADVTLSPGTRLDYLELVEPLGEGGFATVWEARDVHTGERIAVKVLRPDVATSEREVARFEEEVALLRRLKAQGCRRLIGPVEAFRVELGGERRLVLKMPVLAGTVAQAAESLRADGRAPAPEQVARWGAEALEALADLHAHGVVHRDVKPSNLLLDHDGHVVLADLGIARDLERDARVTRTGEAVGSDLYMAPEQRRSSRPVTGEADVYGLACTLHELLTGDEPVIPGKGVVEPLGAALRHMSAADPEERPDALEAARLLARVTGAKAPASARKPGPRLLGVVSLATVLIVGGLATLFGTKATPAICGDGRVEGPEECDDGNPDDGDLCTALCSWNVATLPAGQYLMGFTEAELDAGMHLATRSRRSPQSMERSARLSVPATPVTNYEFAIMRTEVSIAAFERFLADTTFGALETTPRTPESMQWHRELITRTRESERPRAVPAEDDRWPVGVKAEEAAAYCAWLGGSVLPEGLWEYAARGRGGDRIYPWGDEALTGAPEDCERLTGFFSMSDSPMKVFNCGGRKRSPVGAKRAGCTEDGVCDLSGNHDEHVHPAPAKWAWETVNGQERVIAHHPGPIDAGNGETSSHQSWIMHAYDDPFGLRSGKVADTDRLISGPSPQPQVFYPREKAMLVVRGGNYDDSMPVFYQARGRWPYLELDDLKGIRCGFEHPRQRGFPPPRLIASPSP